MFVCFLKFVLGYTGGGGGVKTLFWIFSLGDSFYMLEIEIVFLINLKMPNFVNFHEGESTRGEVSCVLFLDCFLYVIS